MTIPSSRRSMGRKIRRLKEQGGRNVEAYTYLKEELVTLNRELRSISRLLSKIPRELKR